MAWSKVAAPSVFWPWLSQGTSHCGMCFVSADLCFGRFFGNELAVTVNLGNVNFPGLKLAPLVTKLLSVFPSTCSPEVRPAARNFHLLTQGWHSQSRAVPAPSQSSAGAGSQCPVPATSQPQGGCSRAGEGHRNSVEMLGNERVLWELLYHCKDTALGQLALPPGELPGVYKARLAGRTWYSLGL